MHNARYDQINNCLQDQEVFYSGTSVIVHTHIKSNDQTFPHMAFSGQRESTAEDKDDMNRSKPCTAVIWPVNIYQVPALTAASECQSEKVRVRQANAV